MTTMSFGQSELIDKWKTKFEEEKVPEVESSLENILGHVLDKDKVSSSKVFERMKGEGLFLHSNIE